MPQAEQVYLVGGPVRDGLLGIEAQDKDWVVVGVTPEQMLERGYLQVGRDFPVFLHPKTKEEYALARTERKQGQGYQGFVCFTSPEVTLEEDLQRRDFTINAMALSQSGELIDPYQGQQDLNHRILRHVSSAFSEDPLRILRGARFLARFYHLGFKIADETLQLMTALTQTGELQHLSAERIWKETERALSEPNPEQYLLTLQHCQALTVLMPQLVNTAALNIETLQLIQIRFPKPYLSLCRWGLLLKPLSEPQIQALCDQLKVPTEYRQFATLAKQHFNTLIAPEQHTAEACLLLLEKSGVFKQGGLWDALLALLQNHPLITTQATAKQQEWLNLAETVKGITAQTFQAQGLKGVEIGQAMKTARLEKIQGWLNAQSITG